MGFLERFFRHEAASGIILLAAAAAAILAANSEWSTSYQHFLHYPLSISVGDGFTLGPTLHFWINDGLMALFFLLIGMEIKRELVQGELSTRAQAMLPVVAACGGVALPALIYTAFNHGTPMQRGWAIPTATDIAFSLGVLALLGSRIPSQLKLFLMAVAIIDDLVAVLVIAAFYTQDLQFDMLAGALAVFAVLFGFNMAGVKRLSLYVIPGILAWVFMVQSGVHATLAGVALGFLIPLRRLNTHGMSISQSFEEALHPWVAFVIMPLFAFANAGVALVGGADAKVSIGALMLEPVTLGIMLGLFAGKQLGIFAAVWLMVKSGFAARPEGCGWLELYGVCMVAGIGFTMSLFIGDLAFADAGASAVRLGVIAGSLLSACGGYALLSFAIRRRQA